jgi:hypothetical protein
MLHAQIVDNYREILMEEWQKRVIHLLNRLSALRV